MTTAYHATTELASIIQTKNTCGLIDGDKIFSHMCMAPLSFKGPLWRLLSKRGLIERHPENDRYHGTTVWRLTEKGNDVRPGEEFSAVV